MSNTVFGIISYFPNDDTDYHKYVRKARMQKCSELFLNLSKLWPDIDIIVIAQNWQDYKLPNISNNIMIYNQNKLGILASRKMLRNLFIISKYEHLIMLDDDISFRCNDPQGVINMIDNNPDSFSSIIEYLRFFVVSKTILNQLDFPNIDIEKGEGFGDKVFLENCKLHFNQYDLSAYIKPDKPHVLNKVPSTWASEIPYDFSYMQLLTMQSIKSYKHNMLVNSGESGKIDIVLPYVDETDELWQLDLARTEGRSVSSLSRFRPWGTLKYLLRGIDKYMPFVRDIILIVARESQIPKWLDTDKIRIVYHKDFIPEEYLPTFNSCTIESFLYNIPDITEQFIYFNDDVFPINTMIAGDFFTNGKPHLNFVESYEYDKRYAFLVQCKNSEDIIAKMLGIENYNPKKILLSEHSAFPMLKSAVNRVGQECKVDMNETVTALRDDRNINQYIYHYYQYYTNIYIKDTCPYMYMEIDEDINKIKNTILNSDFKLFCINDLGVSDYETIKSKLISIFEEKFPDRSKYESL